MNVCERAQESLADRVGSLTVITGAADENVNRVRLLMIEVIRETSVPLWQRIVSLGLAVDRIAGVDSTTAVGKLKNHLIALKQGLLQGIFASLRADPAFQLETVLKLVVARLGADYTPPGFVDCYREFMRGLEWTNESTMEELASRYHRASEDCLLPFLHRHEHLLENYLANYIFMTIFPYRRRLPNQTFAIDSGRESMQEAFLLLATHYAIVKTLFVGIAALHQQNLDIRHAIKLVQSYSKAFLHYSSFETLATQHLGKNVQNPSRIVAALVMD
jgi:lysine-N-methylase